jgi:aminopeptidase N
MQKLALAILILFSFLQSKAQTTFPTIDVQHYTFAIILNDHDDNIKGQATIDIKFIKNASAFQLNLVKTNAEGKGMTVSSIKSGGRNIAFSQDSDVVNINSPAKSGSFHSYVISYKGVPADGLIISKNEYGHRTFFGDNWPNRAHNWLPCADYPADKATVDFVVTAPAHYQVVANGLKTEEKTLPNDMKLTHWKETAPLPTKVMVIGVADFAVDHTGDVGNIPVYAWVFPENKDEGFKNYTYATEILPFYIKMFGPFAYEKLANVQSKTIFGGMENASAIFYFEKSATSKRIEDLMAHEIAHQWFGDAASEKSFAHLWLSEGFATYMTNVYLEHKYGPDTLKKREAADRNTVFRFEKRRNTPVVDTTVKSNFMQMLNANSYQKGGWVLHMLRRKLGDTLFFKGIRAYYAQYKNANANTDDFRVVMEKASGQNLEQFFKQWLYTPGHPKLAIEWVYDDNQKRILLSVAQKQEQPFAFPLQIAIDGQVKTFYVNGNSALFPVSVNARPTTITVDPNVNLLAEFEVSAK